MLAAASGADSWSVIVIGAGAAGLLAATRAAERGQRVLLLEKNNKPGVKILMSGGTRCNLTHATDRRGIADAFTKDQARFLRAPLAALGPDELIDLFNAAGLPTKVESTGKIFPESDRALDVQRTLLKLLDQSGAQLALGEAVAAMDRTGANFVVSTNKRILTCEKLILASGGQSYPGCGTTGDGYAWAKVLGHSIVPPRPALVALKTCEAWAHELSGITLADAVVSVIAPESFKRILGRRGSLLFTHFGLSGPAVMDISRVVTAHPRSAGLSIACDFLPELTTERLTSNLQSLAGKKQVAHFVSEYLPKRLTEALFTRTGVPLSRVAAELSKTERTALVQALKHCQFTLSGTLGFAKAEVTAGGVALDEVDSKTMQSRLTPGLYIIGEVLDIDGPIGGYNFQAAFSTGWLAGQRV